MDEKTPTIDVWKGAPIAKMARKELEAEFVKLAQRFAVDMERFKPPLPLPPLDPHTARSLRELQSVCGSIERGEAGVLEFADSIEAEPKITRKMLVVVGYATRKP